MNSLALFSVLSSALAQSSGSNSSGSNSASASGVIGATSSSSGGATSAGASSGFFGQSTNSNTNVGGNSAAFTLGPGNAQQSTTLYSNGQVINPYGIGYVVTGTNQGSSGSSSNIGPFKYNTAGSGGQTGAYTGALYFPIII